MVDPKELAILILLGMFFVLIMSIGIIMLVHKNRKIKYLGAKLLEEELANKEIEKLGVAISTQETERSKIARLLHDDVGALLSLAQKNLSNLEDEAVSGKIDVSSISLSKEYVSESIEHLRQITKGLIPQYLLKFGLVKALERMAKQKTDSLIDSFKFNVKMPDDLVIPDLVMTHYFYIVSELFTNLLKHSYPSSIEMILTFEAGYLKLKIKHNGIALTQRDFELLSSDSDSLGLENIRYRLNVIKGELVLKRNKTYGTIELITNLDKSI
jgi:two-component system, NarL family, sensor kinase